MTPRLASVDRRVISILLAGALALSCAGKTPTPTGAAAPAGASSPAQAAITPRQPVTPETQPLPVDPATRKVQLDNGLTVYVRRHAEPEKKASLRLVVNAGSVLETEEQRGVAHLVEHMAFNGTRLFKKQEIVDYMERVGMRFGQDANASTSFDETIYMFEVPTDDQAILDKGLQILQQIAAEVAFDPDEVDRERKVVIEEWRLGRGAGMRVMEQVLPTIFKGSRYAERLPIGTRQVLEKVTAAELRRFYETWYRPDLMAVIAVGDFDPAKVETRIRELFGKIAKRADAPARPTYAVPDHGETLVAIGQDKEMPSTNVGVLHKLPKRPESSARDYRRGIVEGLYHDMMNARLDDLRRSKSPPFLFAMSATQPFVRPTEIFAQMAGAKQGEVARALESLTREVERVDRHGFTAGELERSKTERLRQMQALVKEREKVPAAGYADEMIRNYLTDEAMPGIEAELRLHEQYLPTIALPELNGFAQEWITEKNRVILVQAPHGPGVPSRAELLSVFQKVQGETIAAYEDAAQTGPLVEKLPPPGKIVSERRIEGVDVVEWKLSNGATVVVKPTEFKNDEILLAGTSPGGHSLVPDRDYVSAIYAADLLGASGLGALDPTALRKALTGKLAAVEPHIGELDEGISGRASVEDLETLLQLTHLTFTAPRRDENVFAAFRAQLGEGLARRDVQPEAVFSEKRETLLYKNHLRRRPLEPGDEKKLDLDRALAIYKQRFADAGGFTFVIVGKVEPDKLKPMVAKYLGALPGKKRTERWRDVGARPIPGETKFEVKRGVEPKSTVSLTFTGPQKWSREEEHLLDSLLEALGIRLREVVREDLGATYGVSVSGGLAWRPREAYRADVVFSSAPETVDKAVAAIWAELEKARTAGLPASYLEKVQAQQRRAYDEGLRSNGFWLGQLVGQYQRGRDPREILDIRKLIDGLTPEKLKAATARYFDRNGYLLGVLQPAANGDKAPSAAAR